MLRRVGASTLRRVGAMRTAAGQCDAHGRGLVPARLRQSVLAGLCGPAQIALVRHVKARVAALYDIHGNLPALEAVLKEVHRAAVDRIVIGGDVVPGPMPQDVLDVLHRIEVPTDFIQGNGDREVLAAIRGTETPWFRGAREEWRAQVKWTAEQLVSAAEDEFAAWTATVTLEIAEIGEVLFCHATPHNDVDCFTRLTPDARVRRLLAGVTAPTVVCGHTHMQFDRGVDNIRIINAGSVGMPFGSPGADWLLLGPGVELRHTIYDLHAAARCIRSTTYPQADVFAAKNVIEPPLERDMLELFTRADVN